MIPVALLVMAAATRVDLVDETIRIPAAEWRYVELKLHQKPALVSADVDVLSGPARVRLALMHREDLDRLRAGRPYSVLAATEPEASEKLRFAVRKPGDYVVVVDNRMDGNQPVTAHLRVSLDFGEPPGPEVTRLSPQRQAAVIAISFAVFFGIVTFSARRLLRAVKR